MQRLGIFLALMLLCAPAAHAESVVWSTNAQNLDFGRVRVGGDSSPSIPGVTKYPEETTAHLINPTLSITYVVQALLLDEAGASVRVLASGEAVPEGSRVRFEFVPHDYTHIYWFASGGVYDSPYGDWVAGATKPSGICQAKNLYASGVPISTTGGRLDLYAALSTDPPMKTVEVGGLASCQSAADGASRVCLLTGPGAIAASFNFAATSARFWPASGSNKNVVFSKEAKQGDEYVTLTRSVPGPFCNTYEENFAVSVPAQSIPFTLSVTDVPDPPAEEEDEDLADEEDDAGDEEEEVTPPLAPEVSGGGGGSGSGDGVGGVDVGNESAQCVVGEPYTISMVSNDPEGDEVRYLIDWNGDGTVDQYVPPEGFVASGSVQSASRTFVVPSAKQVRVRAQDADGLLSQWSTFSFTCVDAEEEEEEPGDEPDNDDDFSDDGGVTLPSSPILALRAVPSLVRRGETTTLNWSATNAERCTVSGTNGDSWSGVQSPVGGEESQPITARVRYTLVCEGLDGGMHGKEVVVGVLPSFQEI